jgi:protein TonB
MNNRILITGIISSILLIQLNGNAQVEQSVSTEDSVVNTIKVQSKEDANLVFDFVDKMPEFPGGQVEMIKFLSKNINYPTVALEQGVQGSIYVQFVIWKDGSVREVKVLRGVDSPLSNEAIRVIKMMPNWEPGTQRGIPVNTRYTLPIKFKLDAGNSTHNKEDEISKAKAMLEQGYKINKISKETSLSKLEIKELEDQMK